MEFSSIIISRYQKNKTGLQATTAKYNWTQNEQGIILSSFYIGYALTHIPGGQLAQNYSSKYVLGLGITVSALLSMIIPWAIQIGMNLKFYTEDNFGKTPILGRIL